jgi:hypothetical protein
MMRHCQHNWSGVLDCTKKGIGELQAEIKRLKVSLGKHSNRILQLHERLKVLQDALDCGFETEWENVIIEVDTPELQKALWGEVES